MKGKETLLQQLIQYAYAVLSRYAVLPEQLKKRRLTL
jgi:hypothetical protein